MENTNKTNNSNDKYSLSPQKNIPLIGIAIILLIGSYFFYKRDDFRKQPVETAPKSVIQPTKIKNLDVESLTSEPDDTTKYILDKNQSTFDWYVDRVIPNTGHHHGQINYDNGLVYINEENKIAKGAFTLNMQSLSLSDNLTPGLQTHLRSSDFFDVDKYPSAIFTVNKVLENTDLSNSKVNYMILGSLSIKDVTKEISFPAIINRSGNQLTASAQINLDDISVYNIDYKDSIKVDVNLVLTTES